MIGIDTSVIVAILIFLTVVLALNYILLRPLCAVLAERDARTTAVVEGSRKDIDYSIELFGRYQAAIRNARAEGYRLLEQSRAIALERRAEALRGARTEAGMMIENARGSIDGQVMESKNRLSRDVEEMARGIAASVLGRPV